MTPDLSYEQGGRREKRNTKINHGMMIKIYTWKYLFLRSVADSSKCSGSISLSRKSRER